MILVIMATASPAVGSNLLGHLKLPLRPHPGIHSGEGLIKLEMWSPFTVANLPCRPCGW